MRQKQLRKMLLLILLLVSDHKRVGKCWTYQTVGPNEHLNIAPPIDAVNLNFVCESEITFTFLFLRRKTTC